MAVKKILDRKPDLVLSGVNVGANLADDVTYSGTVAGAIEGTLQGIRSIALSQAYQHAVGHVPWGCGVAETHAPALIRTLMGVDLPDGTLINLNFPNCAVDAVAGVEVTSQGSFIGLSIDERTGRTRLSRFRLRFGERAGDFRSGTDIRALRDNRISVTPLKLDMTDHAAQGHRAGIAGGSVA